MNPALILLIGVVVVIGGILVLRMRAFLALIAGALVVALLTPKADVYQYSLHAKMPPAVAQVEADKNIGRRFFDGFWGTAKQIGILIIMAAILGKTLMDSGAAERIVVSLRRGVGDARVSIAFLISGFVLAALVLSDTTFYLLIPLARVMRARTGRDYTLYILAIVAGAVMTHSLVPPAAGPVMVATQLHVNLFTMILGGIIVGGIASTCGYLFALWANAHMTIPIRSAAGVSAEELEQISTRDENTLPNLPLSLLPIALPVLLIAGGAIAKQLSASQVQKALQTVGDPNLALTIAAAIGMFMVIRLPRQLRPRTFPQMLGQALSSGGMMVLTICCGGALGYLMRQTDIATVFQKNLPHAQLALLPLAFLVTCAVRTSVGSAIVSMITAIGIVAPIALAGKLGFHPVYLALAIGCGSKPILWMNDAGFWIIGQMSGMTETETLKTVSVMMAIMAVVGLIVTMLGAWLLPMN
jgi:gluconate:H+ symporter, GntP family